MSKTLLAALEAVTDKPMPENDTSELVDKNPDQPDPQEDSKEIEIDLTEELKSGDEGIQFLKDISLEAEEFSDNVDQAEDAAGELEQYRDIVEGAQSQGGLDPEAAMFLDTAMENLKEKLGIPSNGTSVPSLESFQSPSRRIGSTKIALEEIGQMIKKVVAAIISAIKTAVSKVKEFAAKVVTNVTSAENTTKKLQEAFKAKPFEAAREELPSEGILRTMVISGRMTKPADYDQMLATMQNLNKEIVSGMGSGLSELVAKAAAGGMSEEQVLEEIGKLVQIEQAFQKNLTSIGEGRFASITFPGDRRFVVSVDMEADDPIAMLNSSTLAMEDDEAGKEMAELKSASSTEATEYLAVANKIFAFVQECNNGVWKQYSQYREKALASLNSLPNKGDELTGVARQLAATMNASIRIQDRGIRDMGTHLARCMHDINQYAWQSHKAANASSAQAAPAAA